MRGKMGPSSVVSIMLPTMWKWTYITVNRDVKFQPLAEDRCDSHLY